MELGSPEAIKGLVETGLGFAIMSARHRTATELQLQVPLAPIRPPLSAAPDD